MSWVVKTLSDGEYRGAGRYWVKTLAEAKRYTRRMDAERDAASIYDEHKPRVIRLVPKRKPEPMPEVTPDALIQLGERTERKRILAMLDALTGRSPEASPLLVLLASNIRAGEHRR